MSGSMIYRTEQKPCDPQETWSGDKDPLNYKTENQTQTTTQTCKYPCI